MTSKIQEEISTDSKCFILDDLDVFYIRDLRNIVLSYDPDSMINAFLSSPTEKILVNAIKAGDLCVIKEYSYAFQRSKYCDEKILKWFKDMMNLAAENGHLEVVKWLSENRKEGCTTDAMDRAARNGYFEVVKWLSKNRKEGCTSNAIDWAAEKGHLEVVKWLSENRKEGCSQQAMDWAVGDGHLEIVKWLSELRNPKENRKEG